MDHLMEDGTIQNVLDPENNDDNVDGRDSSNRDENNSSSCSVDNSGTVISKIANLYAERLMSDVCLVVGNVSFEFSIKLVHIYNVIRTYKNYMVDSIYVFQVEYPSHRLILCASSDVFQVMLMNSNWSSSRTAKVVLGKLARITIYYRMSKLFILNIDILSNRKNVFIKS